MIANLLNIRNIAILAGVLAAGWGGHVWIKNIQVSHYKSKAEKAINKRDYWEAKFNKATSNLKEATAANKSNQQTIAEIQQAHQQCAQSRELNEQTAQQEQTRQSERIVDIKRKYDELKKIKVVSQCADVVISDDVIRLLQTRDSYQN